MCCAPGFCNNCQSCMHVFFLLRCIFLLFRLDFFNGHQEITFFFGGEVHPFTLRLEAWSFLGCEMQNDAGASLKMGDPLEKEMN